MIEIAKAGPRYSVKDPKVHEVLGHFRRKLNLVIDALGERVATDGSIPLLANWAAGQDRRINIGAVRLWHGLELHELTTAPGAVDLYGRLYVKSADSGLYYKNKAGTEFAIGGRSGAMVVTTNQTNSTTTPANVTGFSFPVKANGWYYFRFLMNVASAAQTTGIHYQFTGPASPTAFWFISRYWDSTPAFVAEEKTAFSSSTTATSQSNTHAESVIEGFLNNGANDGTVQMQFDSEVATSQVAIYKPSVGFWHLLN